MSQEPAQHPVAGALLRTLLWSGALIALPALLLLVVAPLVFMLLPVALIAIPFMLGTFMPFAKRQRRAPPGLRSVTALRTVKP